MAATRRTGKHEMEHAKTGMWCIPVVREYHEVHEVDQVANMNVRMASAVARTR